MQLIERLRLHFSEIATGECYNVITVCKLFAEIRSFFVTNKAEIPLVSEKP